jgi:hypothetical protein
MSENPRHRHIWPGLFTSRNTDRQRGWTPQEIPSQIQVAREKLAQDAGHVHFSMKALMGEGNELVELLKSGPYRDYALVPPSPWLDRTRPPAPGARSLHRSATSIKLQLTPGWFDRPWLWAIWIKQGSEWTFKSLPGSMRQVELPLSPDAGEVQAIVISSIDRCSNESDRVLARME